MKIPFYFLPICVIFFPLTVLSYYVLYQIIKMKNEAGGKSPSQYLSISNEGRKKRQLVLRLMLIILDFMVLGFYLGIFIKLIQVSLSLAIDLYSKEINIGSTVNYSIAYIGIILLIFSPVYLFNKLSFFCPNCQRRLHKFPLSRNLEASIKGEFVCQNCGFKYSILLKDEMGNG